MIRPAPTRARKARKMPYRVPQTRMPPAQAAPEPPSEPLATGTARFYRSPGHADDVALIRTASPDTVSDAALGEWDVLFRSIRQRLDETVGEPSAVASEPWAPGTANRIRASLAECVAALDQLQATAMLHLDRHRQLEREVVHAQTALARMRAELVGTKAGERRARYQAAHDNLTALPNRVALRERLDQGLCWAKPRHRTLALLYLDLDGFKPINDAHGHESGDELLRIVATRLSQSIRAEDIVSRIGGDEFACLLTDVSCREQLSQLASKLIDAVAAPVRIGMLDLSVRPSIGIATYPLNATTADALLQNADAAMYHAKRAKTGYAFYDECSPAPVTT